VAWNVGSPPRLHHDAKLSSSHHPRALAQVASFRNSNAITDKAASKSHISSRMSRRLWLVLISMSVIEYRSSLTARAPTRTFADPSKSAEQPNSLKNLAIRGSIWTIAGYSASQILRLAGNVVMAHLLFPSAFGLMSLVNIFLQGLRMFSDIGINPSIIQSKRGDDPVFLHTAWTIQVMRGGALWLGSIVLAWPMSWFYGSPELIWLIPVAGLSAVAAGFISTSLPTHGRRLALGKATTLHLSAQMIAVMAMVGWARVHRSVWALVFGGVVYTVVLMAGSHLLLPGVRCRFAWDREARQELFGFGKWIFVSSVLTFFAGQLDRLMLGKLVPLEAMGIYSVAMVLASLPQQVAGRLAASVIYPVLAKHARGDAAQFGARVRRVRNAVLPSCLVISLAMLLGAPLVVEYLYDSRYQSAAWMAQWLSIYMWFWMLQNTADRALLAVGDSRSVALSTCANLVVTTIGCVAGFHLAGMRGFILGLGASSLAGHVVVQASLKLRGVNIIGQDLMYTAAVIALGVIGIWAASAGSAHVRTEWALLVRLACSGAVILGAGVCAASYTLRQIART
jgi:O-antigen/teichoic acid export membrane protein